MQGEIKDIIEDLKSDKSSDENEIGAEMLKAREEQLRKNRFGLKKPVVEEEKISEETQERK